MSATPIVFFPAGFFFLRFAAFVFLTDAFATLNAAFSFPYRFTALLNVSANARFAFPDFAL